MGAFNKNRLKLFKTFLGDFFSHLTSNKMAKVFYGLLLLASAFAVGLAEESVDLGDSDFDSSLEAMDTALVMFYAPW